MKLLEGEELPEDLKPLVFEVRSQSETPLFRLFERLPRDLVADRLDRRRFLISAPIRALRELLQENADLKFSKGLLFFLMQEKLEVVQELIPKHRLIPPQDLQFRLLSVGEVKELSPALKARHLYFGVEYEGSAERVLEILKSRLPFVLSEGSSGKRVVLVASLADLIVYLLKPLEHVEPLKEEAEEMLLALRRKVPECFGEGG